MGSWYNNLISKTSNGIRGFLQAEADGDTEDDTHVCRVLRSYYTEKHRAFPGWLPPDPHAPPPPPPPTLNTIGSGYGGLGGAGAGAGAGRGGLKSLWDTPGAGQQAPAQPTSLRQGGGRPGFGAQGSSMRGSPFAAQPTQQGNMGGGDGRPVPVKQGSYSRDPGTGGGGNSAQDRLKQRLWGGGTRTASPQSTGGPFQPPQQQAPPPQQQRQYSAYSAGASNGGGGGGGYGQQQQQQDYGRGGRQGLPNGPRGGGLPSGPRMRG